MKKLIKRALSLVLVFAMLITTFCFFDIGILKSDAWLNVSDQKASQGRPTVKISVPETIYLKYNTSTFQYYVDRDEGGNLSVDPAKTTGNISFVSSFVCSSISVDASNASGSGGVSVTYTNGNAATYTTVLKTDVNGGTATGGTVIKWTFTYTIDSQTYNSYAFTYVYAPAANNVIGAGFAGHVKGTMHNGYSSYLGLTAGLHSIASSSNGTYEFNLKSQDSAHTAPLDISVGTNAGNVSYIPRANGRDSDGNHTLANLISAGILTEKTNGGIFWWPMPNGNQENQTMTGYIPQGSITVDTSRYSNLNQIPNLQAVGYFTYLEWADPVKCTFYTGTGSYGNATNQFVASGDYESDDGDGKNHYFSARINQAISGNTSVFVKQYSQYKYNGTFDNWYIEVYLWNQINVATVNKATLREKYEAACNKALRTDNESASVSQVSEYLSALQTAGANLGNPTSTATDTSTLTTKAAAVDTLMTSTGHVVESVRLTPEIYFYVPECIYLTPGTDTFQYYLDRGNSDNSELNHSKRTEGNVYFHCEGATDISITYSSTGTFADVKNVTLKSGTGATISEKTITGGSNGTIATAITGGKAEETTAGAFIPGKISSMRWDVTFTAGGRTYTSSAFSVIYSPYLDSSAASAQAYCMGSALIGPRYRRSGATAAIFGINGLVEAVSTSRSVNIGTNSFSVNTSHVTQTAGIFKPKNSSGTQIYPITNPDFPVETWTGESNTAAFASGTGGYLCGYRPSTYRGVTSIGGVGYINVDSSRFVNFGDIPNFGARGDYNGTASDNSEASYASACYVVEGAYNSNNTIVSAVSVLGASTGLTAVKGKADLSTTPIFKNNNNNSVYLIVYSLCQARVKDNSEWGDWQSGEAFALCRMIKYDKSGLREALNDEISQNRQQDWYTPESWSDYFQVITDAYSQLGNPLATDAAAWKSEVESAANKLVLRPGTATALHQSITGKKFETETKTYDFGATVTAGNNEYEGYTYEGEHGILNLEEWYKTNSKNCSAGGTVNYSDGVVTFTSDNTVNGETTTSAGENSALYSIPIEPETTYVIKFTAQRTAGSASGQVFFFPFAAKGNWQATPNMVVSSNGTYSFEYTTSETAQYAQFRFDVNGPSTTWKYSNLLIYKKTGTDTVIPSARRLNSDWTFLYTPNTYNVTYNPNGGSFNGTTELSSNTATYDANYSVGSSINSTEPTRAGYHFTGWECSANGETYDHGDVIEPWNFTKDIIFTAQWDPNVYNVYYVPNDPNAKPTSNQLINTGLSLDYNIDTATDTFTKTGYSIYAWSTKSDSCILEGDTQNAVPAGTRINVYKIAEAQGKLEVNNADLFLYANYIQSMVYFDVNHDNIGVNVFAPKIKTTSSNGLTLSYDESTGVFTLNGTQTASSADFLYSAFTPQDGETYTFSITQVGGSKTAGDGCVVLEPSKGESNTSLTNRKNCDFNGTTSKTFTFNSTDVAECKNLRFWVWHNSTANVFNNFQFKIKVEKKSSKTEYSPAGRQISGDTYGSLPADPTRTGYTFAGWFDAATGGNQITASSAYVSATNHTLYAHWTNDTFNLKYNENKPSTAVASTNVASMPSPNPQTLTYDTASSISSATPTLTGYTFVKWNTKADGTGTDYDKSASLNEATVNSMYLTSGVGKGGTYNLYAKWTPNTNTAYKVQVYVMGTNGSYPATVTYTFNATGTTDATVTINSGNFATFAKNSTTGITDANISQFSLDSTHAGSVLTGPVKNDGSSVFTIYVKRAQHTLTLDAATNGGLVSPTSVTLYYGQTYTLPTATKSGYTHKGWDDSASATTTVDYAHNGTYTMGMADAKLYAIFCKEYVVTWHYYNNATSTTTFTLYNNQTSAQVATPSIASVTRDGVTYTGRGWSTATTANASSPTAADSNVTVSGSCDYYASYSANITGTFYYCVYETGTYNFNSTAKTATATATRYMNYAGTYVESNYTVPANVTAATVTIDGKTYNQGMEGTKTYNGLSTAAGSNTVMTGTPTTAITKYYAVYSVPVNFTYYNGTTVVKETKTRYATCNSSNKYVPSVPGEPTPTNYDGSTRFVRSNGYNWANTTSITSLTNDISKTFGSTSRATTMTSGTSFYALYQKDAVIEYDKNAGSDTVSNMPVKATKTAYYVCTAAGEPASVIKPFNNTNTVSNATPIPARDGYAFMGWNTSSSATEAQYTGDETLTLTSATKIGTTTLYAVWYDIRPAQQKYDNRTDYKQETYDVVIGVDSSNNQVVDTTEKAYYYDNDEYTTYVKNYTAYVEAKTGATTIAGSNTLIEKAKTLEETAYPTAGKVVDKYYNNFSIDGSTSSLHNLGEINLNHYKTVQLDNASDALNEGAAAKGNDATSANQKAMNDAVVKMATAYNTKEHVASEPTYKMYDTNTPADVAKGVKEQLEGNPDVTGVNYVFSSYSGYTYYCYTNNPNPVIALQVNEIAAPSPDVGRVCYPTTAVETSGTTGAVTFTTQSVTNSTYDEYIANGLGTEFAKDDKGNDTNYYKKQAVIAMQPSFTTNKQEFVYKFEAYDDAYTDDEYNYAARSALNGGISTPHNVDQTSAAAKTIANDNEPNSIYDLATKRTTDSKNPENGISIVICYKGANGFSVYADENLQWANDDPVFKHDLWLNKVHLYRNAGGASNSQMVDRIGGAAGSHVEYYVVNDPDFGQTNYGSFLYVFESGSDSAENCTINLSGCTSNDEKMAKAKNFFKTPANFEAAYAKGFSQKNTGGTGLGYLRWLGSEWSIGFYPKGNAYVYVHLVDRWGNVAENFYQLPNLDFDPAKGNTASAGSVVITEDGGSGIDTASINANSIQIITDDESELNGKVYNTTGNTVKIYTGEPNKSYTLKITDNAANASTVTAKTDAEGYLLMEFEDVYYTRGVYSFTLNDFEINLYSGVECGKVVDAWYEAAIGTTNTYSVKVEDRANMLQFVESDHGDGTGTRSFDRYDERVTITSYDKDGNVVGSTSKDLAYEIWTVETQLADGNIDVRVKESGSSAWEDMGLAYRFENKYAAVNSSVISAELAKTEGAKGGIGFTVVTGADVKSVQLKNEEGETTTISASKATVNENGTLTFTGKVWFHGTGTRTATVRILDAYGWHDSGTLTYEINK